MAFLWQKNSKSSLFNVNINFKEQKFTQNRIWPLRLHRLRSTQNARQNVFKKISKNLRKSMTILRQRIFKNNLKTFLKRTSQSFSKYIMATKQQVGFSSNTRETSTGSNIQKPSIIIVALNLFHRFLCLCVRFVLIKVHGENGPSMPPIEDLLLLESASSIAEKIRTKKVSSFLFYQKLIEIDSFVCYKLQVTSTQVLNSFIARIKQVNSSLNCVVDDRFKDALQDAAKVDELIASDKYTADQLRELKPFLGVPISTKDCISVKRMLHTGGLWLRRNVRANEDADSIRLMREAGAIPFAITNVSEVCMW